MTIFSRQARLLASCIVVLVGLEPAFAAPPTVAQMLGFKPRQDGINISTPGADAETKCKVEPVNGRGWKLVDEKGNVMRLFYDSNGDNKVDIWSYFKDGVEVYREIDSTFTGKPDQYRWLNSAGSKWGVDESKDGRIKKWKVISPEEVSQEILSAVSKNDLARLQALLITEDEVKTLGLPNEMNNRVHEQLKKAPTAFSETVSKLGAQVGPKVNWVHLETAAPQAMPADQTGGRYDIVRHSRGTILFETEGKTGWLQTGEMIQVGSAWRLTSAPIPGAEDKASGGTETDTNPKLMKLLDELQALDKGAPPTTGGPDPRVVEHHLKRADLLEKIVAEVKAEEREPWIRQVADSLSTAAQSSAKGETRAMTRLQSLEQQLVSKMPGSNLAGYVTYREMQANYTITMSQNPDPKDFSKFQEAWLEKLSKFVAAYPHCDDTPDVMLQAGMVSEFLAKDVEAKNWYNQVVKNFPTAPQAQKAAGAVKRLELEGQPLKLVAPLLNDPNKTYDVEQMKGKAVVVYYWATWNTLVPNDFTKLKWILETNKGVELLLVNLDNDAREAKEFLSKNPAPTAVHLQQPGGIDSKLATDYGIMVLPHLFLINRDGKVASRTVQINNLEEEIKKVMK